MGRNVATDCGFGMVPQHTRVIILLAWAITFWRVSTVVVLGSCNVDLVVQAPRHPQPGETLLGSGLATHPGGKGANQAVAASRAGASVAMIGRLGADSGAEFLRRELVSAGVDITPIGTCQHDPTGTALITVTDTGENTIIVVPGANGLLQAAHVDDALVAGVFDGAKVVLVQLEIPLAAVRAGLMAARSVGARTMLNAAPSQPLPADIVQLVDVLVVNEGEFFDLVGSSSVDPVDWPPIGGVATVVLTLGPGGVVFGAPGVAAAGERDPASSGSLPGYRIEVVDTTAAGDTLCGYLAAALAQGQTLNAACRLANAAAALACTKPGAQPSIPFLDDVLHFLATER